MANSPMVAASTLHLGVSSCDKENLTPNMKTTGKYSNSSGFSPFSTPGVNKHKPFKILSDDEIVLKTTVGSSSGKKVVKNVKRRSLATLQPTSQGKGKLVGNGRETLSIKDAFTKKKAKATNSINLQIEDDIQKDMKTAITEVHEEQVEADQLVQDALALMKSTENDDESYWKNIAKERRLALEETLQENEKLYDEIDVLQEENDKLKKLLNEAGCFKLLYQNLKEQTETAKA